MLWRLVVINDAADELTNEDDYLESVQTFVESIS
jgi:hypothetical protein